MSRFSPLPAGTEIVATRDFGAVTKGQWGIITGDARRARILWWRWQYLCLFLGDMHVVATTRDIAGQAHGCSKEMLEDPLWFLHHDEMIHPYCAKNAWRVLRMLDTRSLAPASPPDDRSRTPVKPREPHH